MYFKLMLFRSSLFRMDYSFKTPGTMAAIAGMTLVSIHDGQRDSMIVWQGFVTFQRPIDLVNGIPHTAGIHLGGHVSHGVGAGHGMAQPTFPERGSGRHLQSVEAPQPRPKQDHRGFGYRGCRDARFWPAVGDRANQQCG